MAGRRLAVLRRGLFDEDHHPGGYEAGLASIHRFPLRLRGSEAVQDGQAGQSLHRRYHHLSRDHGRCVEHPRGSCHVDDRQAVAVVLAELGATRTHSPPHVSNDNPFTAEAAVILASMRWKPCLTPCEKRRVTATFAG